MLSELVVNEVAKENISISSKLDGSTHQLDYGVCVWANGRAPTTLVKKIQSQIPGTTTTTIAAVLVLLIFSLKLTCFFFGL